MKNKKPERKALRKTVYYISEDQTARDVQQIRGDIYSHMFVEDVSMAIMPIPRYTAAADFAVHIEPANTATEELIATGLASHGRGYRTTLAEALCDFFRGCASQIAAHDRAAYEVVRIQEVESKNYVGFQLDFVDPSQIVEAWGGGYYQTVIEDVARERGVPKKIPLGQEDLLWFEAPPTYKKALSRLRHCLSELDDHSLASAVLAATEQKFSYDFKAHHEAMKLALAKIARPLGWTARGTLHGTVMSFYTVLMQARFAELIVLLREEMLSSLNAALRRIGAEIGFSGQIKIDGVRNLSDIAQARKQLESGEVPFTKILNGY